MFRLNERSFMVCYIIHPMHTQFSHRLKPFWVDWEIDQIRHISICKKDKKTGCHHIVLSMKIR